MSWAYLLIAGLFEIVATTLFRYTEGLTRVGPTLAFFAVGVVSFYCLSKAIIGDNAIPLGTAYAIWTGIGAAGTALIGLTLYGEPASGLRVLLLMVLIGSIVGLKLVA